MKSAEDNLSSVRSRVITGNLAGMSGQYRDNYKVIDFPRFGKLPQEAQVQLSPKTSGLHFGFLQKGTESVEIEIGKAIKFKKSLDFTQLENVIKELEHIKPLVAVEEFSSYDIMKDEDFIESNLRSQLIGKIYGDAENFGKSAEDWTPFQFDFCNPNNIKKFYEADSYLLKEKGDKGKPVKFDVVENRRSIYKRVISRALELKQAESQFDFMVYLQGVRVLAYKNGKKLTGSLFLLHFSAEFSHENKPYFLMDTKWYILRDSFVKDMYDKTLHILTNNRAPESVLSLPWDKSKTATATEPKYNCLYENISGYIVVDTVIADSIELCDVIHFDTSNLYLIHVKHGFSSKVRELTNQILIAARRLKEAVAAGNYSYLETIYNSIVAKGRSVSGLSQEEFIDLFRDGSRILSFVIGYTSHLTTDYVISENLSRFTSNIARYSLISCSNEMRADFYDLLSRQIMRE
jgi:hypothetical protein